MRPIAAIRGRYRAYALRKLLKSPRLRAAMEQPIVVGKERGRERGHITRPLRRCNGLDLVTGSRYSRRLSRQSARKKRVELAGWHERGAALLAQLAEEVGVGGQVLDLKPKRIVEVAEVVADLRETRPATKARSRAGQGIAGYV